ncbi:TPA: hypothetical protein DCX16_00875 [bacterium]|nr:hypothetical protein [bacterium]
MDGRRSLNRLWRERYPVLGHVTFVGITKNVISKLELEYPVLSFIKINHNGFNFKEIERKEGKDEALSTLYHSLNHVINHLIGGIK